jgi:hypothetical protein
MLDILGSSSYLYEFRPRRFIMFFIRRSQPLRRFNARKPSCRPRLEPLEDRRVPSTFTVTTTADDLDGGTLADPAGPDGTLSLREAITVANLMAGTDTIAFNIAGIGVQTITPGSPLPTISDPVLIDGTTEGMNVPGAAIEVDGASAGAAANGLDVPAGNSTIRGLAINRFAGNGILL